MFLFETQEKKYVSLSAPVLDREGRNSRTVKWISSNPHVMPFVMHNLINRKDNTIDMGLAPLPKGEVKDEIRVFVNHGRWITQCPFCNSAQVASEEDHRFYCANCHNTQTGNCSMRVVWPSDPEAIERVLIRRDPINRNWLSHETLKDLRDENKKNGVK